MREASFGKALCIHITAFAKRWNETAAVIERRTALKLAKGKSLVMRVKDSSAQPGPVARLERYGTASEMVLVDPG